MKDFKTFLIIALLLYSIIFTGLNTYANKVLNVFIEHHNTNCSMIYMTDISKNYNLRELRISQQRCQAQNKKLDEMYGENYMIPKNLNLFERLLAYYLRELGR